MLTPHAGPTAMRYVYVFSLAHTLGAQGVNHKQLPYGAFCMDYIYEEKTCYSI